MGQLLQFQLAKINDAQKPKIFTHLQSRHFQFEAGEKSGRNSNLFGHGRGKIGVQPLNDGLVSGGRRRPKVFGIPFQPVGDDDTFLSN